MNRLEKEILVHIYMCVCVCYSAMKKDEILPFATTWMDLDGIMLHEVNQTKNDKYCMIL